MTETFRTISPVDASVYVERPHATEAEVEAIVDRARVAQHAWAHTSLAERRALATRLVDVVVSHAARNAEELTWQIGRPIRQSPGEMRGFEERGRAMIGLAESALSDIELGAKEGFRRFMRKEPLGVVFVLAPWNYPWLTAVNTVVPALVAGNTVILKHSEQTPLVAERFREAADEAGLPAGVLQHIHATHDVVSSIAADPRVAHVAFTGSVEGGRSVHRATAERFVDVGLELGGKDPAYVRPDAPFEHTVENLVDGSFFNAGQSCCGVERIYVHRDIYDRFVEAFVAETKKLRLGDPTDAETTLGPVVRVSAAARIRAQVAAALSAGAHALIDEAEYPARERGPAYMPPQVLVDVDHGMDVMTEETFGPVVGIMPVASDDEAIQRMNDSRYGLTASIWTADLERAVSLGDRVETGTLFLNRCDYLDPELAWVGVKDSGRGVTLSRLGYEQLTRPKSFHLRRASET